MTKDIEALDTECAALPIHADVVQIDKEYNEKNKDTYGYRHFLCKRLTEMGYVKATRCKDCVYWGTCNCDVCKRYLPRRYCANEHNYSEDGCMALPDFYCGHGEPKEEGE